MKNTFSPFAKLVAVAACALTLGSCNRAEYAMLPVGSSYHGVTRVATPVPAKSQSTAVVATPVATEVVTPQEAASAPVAAPTPVVVAATVTKREAAAPAVASVGTASTIATPAPKMNLAQRIAMNKVTRKVDKLIQKSGAMRKHDNTASTSETSAISGNLRTGLIFLLVGLLISLFSGISGIFGIIGAIFAVIGLVFIILWLLDQA